MRVLIALLLAAVVLTGCNEATKPSPSQADQVRAVSLKELLPGAESGKLVPDRDRDQVEQILQWVNQAKPVTDEEAEAEAEAEALSRARKSRILQIEFKDGTTLQAEWAVQCGQTNNDSTQCTAVRDRVVLSGGAYKEDAFVQSKELYELLMNPPQDLF